MTSTNHFKNFSVQRTARKKYQILEKLTAILKVGQNWKSYAKAIAFAKQSVLGRTIKIYKNMPNMISTNHFKNFSIQKTAPKKTKYWRN